MSQRRVLTDTGAVFALVTRTDRYHQDAKAFAFAETMTLLKARLGSAAAIQTGRGLRQSLYYEWETLGVEGERDTWAVFQQYADKEWSYANCGLLVASRRLRIPEVFGFDTLFGQMPQVVMVP